MTDVRFLPFHLSKTDLQTHLGLPILILRLSVLMNASICPFRVLGVYLHRWEELHVAHDYIWLSSPHDPISTVLFSALWRPKIDARHFHCGSLRLGRGFGFCSSRW